MYKVYVYNNDIEWNDNLPTTYSNVEYKDLDKLLYKILNENSNISIMTRWQN